MSKLIVDMAKPKMCITKDGYYGNCPMDRVWCIQENAPSEITMVEAYAEMTENIPSWCPIKDELLTCRECKWWDEEDGDCSRPNYLSEHWYCADGERKEKTDEQADS